MKKQENIDKIFSEGLHNYERQPRSEAWEKLQARLEKPQSKVLPLWWKFASAASIALLLGAGGYWFKTQQETQEGIANISTQSFVKKNIVQEIKNQKVITQNNIEISKEILNTKDTKIVSKHHQKHIIATVAKQENKLTPQNVVIPSLEIKKGIEQNTIVLVLENTKPKISKIEEETIVLNFVDAKPENTIAQTNPIEENNKKQSRLGKIWQQLKNAKNGEDVNWGEVGIKPQKVLARADAKIENALTKGENSEK